MNLNDFILKFAEQFDETDVKDFTGDTCFKLLEEWSSLMSLSIIAMVDEEYGIRIKGDDIKSSETIKDLYDLNETIAAKLFEGKTYPWEVLADIGDFIMKLGPTLPKDEFNQIEDNIWVHKTVKIAPTASLTGPLIVDADTEIRPSAFVRGKAIVGKNCVVGNSTELKNVVLFNTVQVPHYNYVGDSILGTHSHMGAGSITSNVKSDKTLVVVKNGDEQIETGLKKFGAMLGDYVEVGCNSVLNPGTVIGRHCNVYPLSSVRGVIPEGHIFKDKNNIIKKK
mgnify:CR=1 FL=1